MERKCPERSRWALIVGCLFASSAVAVVPIARTVEAAPAGAPEVTLLGDSTMAAMQWYQYDDDDADGLADNDIREIVAERYDLTFSAESCRRLVLASCTGRFGTRPVSLLPYIQTTLRGQLGDAVVIMAGYDDPSITAAVDQIMAESERQGVASVIWLTFRTGTSYILPGGTRAATLYESHNAELRAAAARHPSLRLLDWNTYAASQPAEWFASDGIHLTSAGAVGLAKYITAELDSNPTLTRCIASSPHVGEPAGATSTPMVPAGIRSGFIASEPKRVLDTRPIGDSNRGNVGAGREVAIDLDDVLPVDATEAVLSVTAVDSCDPGYLTVYACGVRPPTSTMNHEVGRTTAGMAITELANRSVCVFTSSATDLVVDLIGAFAPSGQPFHPMTPIRWIDTRGGPAVRTTGDATSSTGTDVVIAGSGGVPTTATAVWVNLTIADPIGATVLLASPGPCGAASLASTVNANNSRNTASTALVGLGPNGSICVHTLAGRSEIVVDVAGWFGPGDGGLWFRPEPLTRLIDTRTTSVGSSTGAVAAPIGAVSVLNAVAVDSTGAGFVSVRPCGSDQTSSLINMAPGQDTANITVVAPGTNGSACAQASTPAQLVVDLVGAFIP